MGLRTKTKYVIYRFAEKGLEIFLPEGEHSTSALANGKDWKSNQQFDDKVIQLDRPNGDQDAEQVMALEADWHELPGVRETISDDLQYVKSKVKSISSEFDKGTYVGIKEAFKKVMPNEYALLKELKDILLDRNSIQNM